MLTYSSCFVPEYSLLYVPDWLIDISSGRLEPVTYDDDDNLGGEEDDKPKEQLKSKKMRKKCNREAAITDRDQQSDDEDDIPKAATTETDEDLPEMFSNAGEQEKARREMLYKHWREHFEKLSTRKRGIYDAPKPFDLPAPKTRPSFWKQIAYQLQRHLILWKRNWYTKLLDTSIIIGAVILISLLDGIVEPTEGADMNDLKYYSVAEPSGTALDAATALLKEFPTLFRYALKGNQTIKAYVAL